MLAGNFIRTPTELAPRVRTGIDLGGTKIEGIVLGDTGNELARRRVPTPQGDYAATVTAIADLVKALEGEAGGHADHVGVGMPGILSSRSGLVKNANSNCLIGKPLDSDLTTALGRPVRLENDANCFAVSEATDGAGEGAGIVFGAILGTGVGAGIVVNGRPLRGANAIAGEWGHNPLPWPTDAERPGPACYCGRCGCIETFLSGSGLSADHARHGGGALAVPDIVLSSDETARQTLDRYVERLARARVETVGCWRSRCGRKHLCSECDLLVIPAGPDATAEQRS